VPVQLHEIIRGLVEATLGQVSRRCGAKKPFCLVFEAKAYFMNVFSRSQTPTDHFLAYNTEHTLLNRLQSSWLTPFGI